MSEVKTPIFVFARMCKATGSFLREIVIRLCQCNDSITDARSLLVTRSLSLLLSSIASHINFRCQPISWFISDTLFLKSSLKF